MQMKNRGTISASIYIGMKIYRLSKMKRRNTQHKTNDVKERLMTTRANLRLRKNLRRDSSGVSSVYPILIRLVFEQVYPYTW